MAIFSKLILGSAILSSLALAAPFGHGKAEWTVTETDYTTIDFTTTIYIDDSKTATGGFQPTFASHSISTSAPLETSSPSPVSIAPAATLAAPSTMSTSTTPSADPASFFPATSSTPPPPAAPAVVETPPAAITTSSTPIPPPTAAAAPATSSTPAAAAAPVRNGDVSAPSSASDSATCAGEGAACQGDITFYGGGLGACGLNVDPTGNGIALPFAFMGPLSNSNPYCGMTLTIFNPATGNSAQAVVMDKCEGCTGRSIDLTPALFDTLTNNDEALGRVHGVDWWFN